LNAAYRAAIMSKIEPRANPVAQFEMLFMQTLTFETAQAISQYEGQRAPQREATEEFDDEPVRPFMSTISPPCPPRSISALLDSKESAFLSVTEPDASTKMIAHSIIFATRFVFELIEKVAEAFILAATPISRAGTGNIKDSPSCGHSIEIVYLALTSPVFSTITTKSVDDEPAIKENFFKRCSFPGADLTISRREPESALKVSERTLFWNLRVRRERTIELLCRLSSKSAGVLLLTGAYLSLPVVVVVGVERVDESRKDERKYLVCFCCDKESKSLL